MNNFQIVYGFKDRNFDVTDVTLEYFLKNDRIIILTNVNMNQIFGDPCPGISKNITFIIDNARHNYPEKGGKLFKSIDILIPSQLINEYKNISKGYPFTAKYGVNENLSVDVTFSVIRYFLNNDKIIIKKNTDFGKYFGNLYGHRIKCLFIEIEENKFIITNKNTEDTEIIIIQDKSNPIVDDNIRVTIEDNEDDNNKLPLQKEGDNNSEFTKASDSQQKVNDEPIISTEQRVLILGKGPTAINVKKEDFPNHIIVGINHSILMIDEIDFFFMNDIESLNGIPEEKFDNIKKIVLPEYPHKNNRACINLTYEYIVEKINKDHIEYEIFNLHTSPKPNKDLIKINTVLTTSDTAIKYLALKYKYKNFDLYGICNGPGYHEEISQNIPPYNKSCARGYNKTRLDAIRNNIKRMQKDYKLDITFN